MAAVEQSFFSEDVHPIDIVESLAEHREWDFDRVAEDQIAMAVEGSWRTYAVSLNWSARDETLRLICTFDLSVPDERRAEMAITTELANDLLHTGCFTLWRAQEVMVYRYGLTLAGGAVATAGQIDAMMRDAVQACERFYPAFQLAAFDTVSPEDAVAVAIAEGYGRA